MLIPFPPRQIAGAAGRMTMKTNKNQPKTEKNRIFSGHKLPKRAKTEGENVVLC